MRRTVDIQALDPPLLTRRLSPAADPALGTAQTRRVTRDAAAESDAHPHADSTGRSLIVLNGIAENRVQIRTRLAAQGVACRSEADADVVALGELEVAVLRPGELTITDRCARSGPRQPGRSSLELAEHAEHIFYVPSIDPILQVPLAVVPIQLFARPIAHARTLNVDRSRNLAKTVAVE